MSIKIDRISSTMVKEISRTLYEDVKDPNVKFVTVTSAKVSSDLSYAKIYVTVLNKEHTKDTLKSLNGAKGFIRNVLKERMDIRNIPELEFVYDESIENGMKIEKIIDKIHRSE